MTDRTRRQGPRCRIEQLAGARPCRLFRPHAGGAADRCVRGWLRSIAAWLDGARGVGLELGIVSRGTTASGRARSCAGFAASEGRRGIRPVTLASRRFRATPCSGGSRVHGKCHALQRQTARFGAPRPSERLRRADNSRPFEHVTRGCDFNGMGIAELPPNLSDIDWL